MSFKSVENDIKKMNKNCEEPSKRAPPPPPPHHHHYQHTNKKNHQATTTTRDIMSNNNMVDITELMECGISSLTIIQEESPPFICNTDTFNLHDAMAASQLTDKKMDSCQIPAHLASPLVYPESSSQSQPPSSQSPPQEQDLQQQKEKHDLFLFPRPPPTRLLDDDFLGPLPWHDLNMSQACCIILEMLVRMQALFGGASICESTFTCLYVHSGVFADMERLVMVQVKEHEEQNNELDDFDINDIDNDLQQQEEEESLLLLEGMMQQFVNLSTRAQQEDDNNANVHAAANNKMVQDSNSAVPSSSSSSTTSCTLLAQLVVFTMSYALLDITDIFRGIVINADIYEEEDFVSNTHGIIFHKISHAMTQRLIKLALQQLSVRLTTIQTTTRIKSPQNSTSSSNHQQEQQQEIMDVKCMILVLTSMFGFYSFCNRMAKVCGPNIDQTVTSMQQLARNTVQNLQNLHQLLLLQQQEQEHHSQHAAAAIQMKKNIQARCFDSYVNRPLLGNAPVRKVEFMTPLAATNELIVIAEQLDWAVCRLLLHGTCLSRIERMLDRVCSNSSNSSQQHGHRHRSGGVNILARSLIVLNLYFDDKLLGRLDVSQLIGHHLQQWQDIPAVYRTFWPVLQENKNFDNADATTPTTAKATPMSCSSMSTVDDSTTSSSVSFQQQQQQDPALAFFSRLAKPVYDTLKLRTSNRNRQRTYLEAVIFRDWTALQHEASIVDVHYYHLHQQQQQQQQYYNPRDPTMPMTTTSQPQDHRQPPPCFGHYVLNTLIRLMDRHLSCGIELGLFYGHDELCSAFWYRDFLLAALSQNLNVMRRGKDDARLRQQAAEAAIAAANVASTTTTPSSVTPTSSPSKGGGKGGKKKNHKNKANGKHAKKGTSSPSPTNESTTPAVSPEELEDDCEMQVLEVKRMLCRGLVRFIVSLRQAGFLTMPRYPFTSLERIFCKRFQVFQSIRHPPALTYGDYLEGSNASGVSMTDIVQSTVDVFNCCKAAIDRLLVEYYNDNSSNKIEPMYAPLQEEEVRGLLKVCVGNSVYLMRLQQLLRSSSSSEKKVKIDFDFDAHKEFCIIKLS